jgi:hypothetical protein
MTQDQVIANEGVEQQLCELIDRLEREGKITDTEAALLRCASGVRK